MEDLVFTKGPKDAKSNNSFEVWTNWESGVSRSQMSTYVIGIKHSAQVCTLPLGNGPVRCEVVVH